VSGQRELVLHSAREAFSQFMCMPGQVEPIEQAARARLGVGCVNAPQAGDELQVLGRLELGVQHRVVRQVGHLLLGAGRVGGQVDAEDLDPAGVGGEQAGHHAQGRRLAGPVRSKQRVQFALPHRQVELVDRGPSEVLGQGRQFESSRCIVIHRVSALEVACKRVRPILAAATIVRAA
jgi:hypothetical protein